MCACGNLSAFQPFLTRDYEFESLGLHTSRAFIFIASMMALIIKLAFHNCSCFYKNTYFLSNKGLNKAPIPIAAWTFISNFLDSY